jgi:dTDP-4-dehydrorhamnose 3,5-epimerase
MCDEVGDMDSGMISGGRYVDNRGVLRFCNDFDMLDVKRFYTISNSAEQPVRGWIGHKKETKWFFPLRGRTVIEVENFNRVDRVERVEMDAERPCVLKVPPGNWFKIVQDGNAEVMVFSDCNVGEYQNDDFRREL